MSNRKKRNRRRRRESAKKRRTETQTQQGKRRSWFRRRPLSLSEWLTRSVIGVVLLGLLVSALSDQLPRLFRDDPPSLRSQRQAALEEAEAGGRTVIHQSEVDMTGTGERVWVVVAGPSPIRNGKRNIGYLAVYETEGGRLKRKFEYLPAIQTHPGGDPVPALVAPPSVSDYDGDGRSELVGAFSNDVPSGSAPLRPFVLRFNRATRRYELLPLLSGRLDFQAHGKSLFPFAKPAPGGDIRADRAIYFEGVYEFIVKRHRNFGAVVLTAFAPKLAKDRRHWIWRVEAWHPVWNEDRFRRTQWCLMELPYSEIRARSLLLTNVTARLAALVPHVGKCD
jgi:hypothetical protein